MTSRTIIAGGLLALLLAVVLGAFGAHGIEQWAGAKRMATWNTAVEYQFYHGLGLLALGIWCRVNQQLRFAGLVGASFVLGILLFSGSLYLLVLTGQTRLGMIAPIGGTLLIIGWLLWLVSVITDSQNESD